MCGMCDKTHSQIRHVCDMTHWVRDRKLNSHTWTSHHCAWHDSFICVWHDSFTCATWLIEIVICVSGWVCLNGSFARHELNETCRTCECVMPHMWMSHVTHSDELLECATSSLCHELYETCRICECVISHIWIRRRNIRNSIRSCHTFKSVMPRMWISHATHVSEACHVQRCAVGVCQLNQSSKCHKLDDSRIRSVSMCALQLTATHCNSLQLTATRRNKQ